MMLVVEAVSRCNNCYVLVLAVNTAAYSRCGDAEQHIASYRYGIGV